MVMGYGETMRNKYVMTVNRNIRFVRKKLRDFVRNSMILARYEVSDELLSNLASVTGDTEEEIALRNFVAGYNYLLQNTDKEADYDVLIELHTILMKDLMDTFNNHLNEEQITELNLMINQPAKANTEIAIDVMLHILDERLFTDGDVRVALMFANKIMIDNGCGFITVPETQAPKFRQLLKEYHDGDDGKFKEWIFRYCVRGEKTDY